MVLMANRYILPAAYRYQGELATSVAAVKAAGVPSKEPKKALDRLSRLVDEAKASVDRLQTLLEHEHNGLREKHAKYFRDKVDSGDGSCSANRLTSSRPSCRRTSGCCQPTGRCCSSSRFGGLRPPELASRGAPAPRSARAGLARGSLIAHTVH
jgi:hypothetical protein